MQQEIEQVIYETMARKWRHVPACQPLAHDVAVAVVGYLQAQPDPNAAENCKCDNPSCHNHSLGNGCEAQPVQDRDLLQQTSEILRRLRGAYIAAGLGNPPPDWQVIIDRFEVAVRAQEHLATLCTERYERMLDLERQLAEARPAILAEALRSVTPEERGELREQQGFIPSDADAFMSYRLRRLTQPPELADPRIEAVIASIRSAPDIGIYAGTDLEPFVCRMLAAADRAQKEAR